MNTSEKNESFEVVCMIIDKFDDVCDLLQEAKFSQSNNQRIFFVNQALGELLRIIDRIHHIEKLEGLRK